MTEPAKTAREAAILAMVAVTETGALLGDALPVATKGLPVADAARAGRLASGTFRWANRADRVLGPHLRLRPEDAVMHVLRLALFELFVEGAAPHGVVHSAVAGVTKSKAGLVNGVLRNVLRRDVDWTALPVPELPKWLRKSLIKSWGKATVQAMERVQSQRPPLDLTPKVVAEAEGWAAKLDGEVLPNGSIRLRDAGQVSGLAGFESGAWWVQDAGATFAARLLDAQPGEAVLDLCAAPGGKTMQLAATGADVVALDSSKKRLTRLHENLARTGLSAKVVAADALKWEPDRLFDAVLLDAPCSATGTLRRHPDLPFARDGSGLDEIVELQRNLLVRAWGWVKPGGRLVYCTCSLFPQEGEQQVEAFLAQTKTAQLAEQRPEFSAFHSPFGLRLRPDLWEQKGGIDGFFIAALQKAS